VNDFVRNLSSERDLANLETFVNEQKNIVEYAVEYVNIAEALNVEPLEVIMLIISTAYLTLKLTDFEMNTEVIPLNADDFEKEQPAIHEYAEYYINWAIRTKCCLDSIATSILSQVYFLLKQDE
jgi:hypothetical protein